MDFKLFWWYFYSAQLWFVLLVVALSYVYLKKCHRYWADKGVPYVKPSSILFGSMADVMVYNVPEIRHNLNIYRQLAAHKFGGYYAFNRPILVVRDPELLKCVLTKDFAHFYDRNENIFAAEDVLALNLFNLTGERWKILRAKLTPTFTSGKMRLMFDTMAERAQSMLQILARTLSEQQNDDRNVEIKDLMSRYTLEVIASCAFGVEANSLEHPDTAIQKIATDAIKSNWLIRIFLSLYFICPKILKYFKIKIAGPNGHEEFYRKLVSDTVSYREQNGIKKNDFIGLLMALKDQDKSSSAEQLSTNQQEETDNGSKEETDNGSKEETDNGSSIAEENKLEMTTDLMAAQCFLFLVAGFESSSSAISFCLLELSKDTSVQERLRQEVDDVLGETNGQITYDALKRMTYMDEVLSETLRMYPPLTTITRVCTKPYKIPDTEIVIETGTIVDIPVVGIHYDRQYYPNPEQFNPDNFSERNKNSRPPYTFLAFGEGQKICIAIRFGMMQIKLALALLMKNYEFKLSDKMKLPLEFTSGPQQVPTSVHGIWVTCNKRKID